MCNLQCPYLRIHKYQMAFSVRFVSFFSVSLGCFFIPPGQEKKKLLQQQQQRQIGSFLLEMSKEYLVCLWLYGILKISEWQKLKNDWQEGKWAKPANIERKRYPEYENPRTSFVLPNVGEKMCRWRIKEMKR